MTVAALEAKALQVALAGESHRLANRFFRAAATVIANPWAIVIGNDLQLLRRDQGPRHRRAAFLPWYVDRVQIAARRDPVVANAFQEVSELVSPPARLLQLKVAARVLAGNVRKTVQQAPLQLSLLIPKRMGAHRVRVTPYSANNIAANGGEHGGFASVGLKFLQSALVQGA